MIKITEHAILKDGLWLLHILGQAGYPVYRVFDVHGRFMHRYERGDIAINYE